MIYLSLLTVEKGNIDIKKWIYVVAILIVSARLNAQSLAPHVIASAGAYAVSSNFSLSWTLGEPVIETQTLHNIILTQGFQQPEIIISNVEDYSKSHFINIYPNPTFDVLKIDIQFTNSSDIEWQLFNTLGQTVKTGSVKVEINVLNKFHIDISEMPPTLYYLLLHDNGNLIKSQKVQKVN
jgi:hypothetical protein